MLSRFVRLTARARRRFIRAIVLTLSAYAVACFAAVPAAIVPNAGESAAFTVAARGVQIYECRRLEGGGRYEWVFVAPEATLFDLQGRVVGQHGAGPFWAASDGSRIIGTVQARADAPAAGAIPWLLLRARNAGGDGVLSDVTSVQRVNTAGGVAPQTACDAATESAIVRVPYTADYVFLKAEPIGPRADSMSGR